MFGLEQQYLNMIKKYNNKVPLYGDKMMNYPTPRNLYVTADNVGTYSNIYMYKSDGTEVWNRKISQDFRRSCLDNDGNLYMVNFATPTSNLYKISPTGSTIWTRSSIPAYNITNGFGDVFLDVTQTYVYVIGPSSPYSYTKINKSTGVIVGSYQIPSFTNINTAGCALPGGSIAICTSGLLGVVYPDNTLAWSSSLPTSDRTSAVCFDSSNNIYVGSDDGNWIVKYNSSGSFVTQSSSSYGGYSKLICDGTYLYTGSVKLDTNLNVIWSTSPSNYGSMYGSITLTPGELHIYLNGGSTNYWALDINSGAVIRTIDAWQGLSGVVQPGI